MHLKSLKSLRMIKHLLHNAQISCIKKQIVHYAL